VCCSMLQCVAESCRELQRVAVCVHEQPVLTNTGPGLSVLQCATVCCSALRCVSFYMHEKPALTNMGLGMSVLQCIALYCGVLQCVAVCCSVLHCVAVCCSVLQCVAVCCSVLQCVAVCVHEQPVLTNTEPGMSVYKGVAVCCRSCCSVCARDAFSYQHRALSVAMCCSVL